MANLNGLNLDPNVKEQTGAFVVLDKGRYRAVIVNDQVIDTKKGDGKILELTWQVVTGPNKGFVFPKPDRLNIINPSSKAQAIGQGQLKRICTICKQPFPPGDTRKCWGIPIDIDVDVEEFESNKEPGKMLKSNSITGYHPPADAPVQEPAKSATAAGSW